MTYRPPLHLHLVVPTTLIDHADWIKRMVDWFTGGGPSPTALGAGIPLFPWLGEGPKLPPAVDIEWTNADRTAMIVLVDDSVVGEDAWREWLERQFAGEPTNAGRFVIALTPNAKRLPKGAGRNQSIHLAPASSDELIEESIVQLSHGLCKWFTANRNGRVGLFLSHAKKSTTSHDGLILAKAIRNYVTSRPAGDVFFDQVSIAAGDVWTAELENAVAESSIIAVVTDPFSSRYWCGWEILQAKKRQRPMVVVDAIEVGEVASLAYLGKSPTVRWDPSAEPSADIRVIRRIVATVLRETLRTAHEKGRLESISKSLGQTVVVTGRIPEPATLPEYSKEFRPTDPETRRTILYPDPPLPAYEVELFAHQRPDLRLVSCTQALAGALTADLKIAGRTVAISISDPPGDDIRRNGFDDQALSRRLWSGVALQLLATGAKLAYGGDPRRSGYIAELGDLARAAADANQPFAEESIRWFVGWPTSAMLTSGEKADLAGAFEFIIDEIPPELDQGAWTEKTPRPASSRDLTAEERSAWTFGMTQMRRRMAKECDARIFVGGQLRGLSPWPGLLEEFELSLGKPIYLVGAFGGMTKALIDAIRRRPPECLTSAFQYSDQIRRETRDLYRSSRTSFDSSNVDPLDIDARAEALGRLHWGSLENGLDADENERLCRSRDITEIVSLVLTGLRRRFPSA